MLQFRNLNFILKRLQNHSRYVQLTTPRKLLIAQTTKHRYAKTIFVDLNNATFKQQQPNPTSLMFSDTKTTLMGFQTKLWDLKSAYKLTLNKNWNYQQPANFLSKGPSRTIEPAPFLEKNEFNKNSTYNSIIQKQNYRLSTHKVFSTFSPAINSEITRLTAWHDTLPLIGLNAFLSVTNTNTSNVAPKETETENKITQLTNKNDIQFLDLKKTLKNNLFDNELILLGDAANPTPNDDTNLQQTTRDLKIDVLLLGRLKASQATVTVNLITPLNAQLEILKSLTLLLLLFFYGCPQKAEV